MAAPKLKLNGKPFDPFPPSPAEIKIKSFLAKSPTDEIYTVDELSRRCGVTEARIRFFVEHGKLDGMSARWGKRNIYGSPAALRAFAQQMTAGAE